MKKNEAYNLFTQDRIERFIKIARREGFKFKKIQCYDKDRERHNYDITTSGIVGNPIGEIIHNRFLIIYTEWVYKKWKGYRQAISKLQKIAQEFEI